MFGTLIMLIVRPYTNDRSKDIIVVDGRIVKDP